MSIHQIRLRGPWTWQCRECTAGDIPPTGRLQMPVAWQLAFDGALGTVAFGRRFHLPTNLADDDCVHLHLTGSRGVQGLQLNEQPLEFAAGTADATAIRVEITTLLQSHNDLLIEVAHTEELPADTPGGLFDVVLLEITSG